MMLRSQPETSIGESVCHAESANRTIYDELILFMFSLDSFVSYEDDLITLAGRFNCYRSSSSFEVECEKGVWCYSLAIVSAL